MITKGFTKNKHQLNDTSTAKKENEEYNKVLEVYQMDKEKTLNYF